MTQRAIEFFYDVSSPYTYLALTQMDALEARTGVPVRFRPFLLGGVFKASGNDLPARVAAKAKWMLEDLARWAAHYDVPFRFPSRFPLNSLASQRALVATERLFGEAAQKKLARALFHAYWVEDRDVSSREVVALLAEQVGLDAAAILEAADAPETKDLLRATTDEAVRRGAFGAPSIFFGDALFFGNDRLALLEATVRAAKG